MLKKKYKIKKDAKKGFNVFYKNWYWPFWVFFSNATTKDDAEYWIANDKQPPEYH